MITTMMSIPKVPPGVRGTSLCVQTGPVVSWVGSGSKWLTALITQVRSFLICVMLLLGTCQRSYRHWRDIFTKEVFPAMGWEYPLDVPGGFEFSRVV